jgi:hypothetical protein
MSERKNGMATAGMICGIISIVLCWVPFAGLVLGILGIVFGSIGMSRAGRIGVGRGAGIAGLVTGILGFILLPMMAAIAIPAFLDYMKKEKTSHAQTQLHRMVGAIKSKYNRVGRLPPSAELMPADPAYCPPALLPSQSQWNAAGWGEMEFRPETNLNGDSMTSYRWTKTSETSGFAEALIDHDCDGVVSTTRTDFQVVDGDLQVRHSEPTPD